MKGWSSLMNMVKRAIFLPPEAAPVSTESPASMERSTEDIRHTLTDLMHHQMKEDMLRRIAAAPSDTKFARTNMSLGVALTEGKIDKLQRDTMIAMLKAAEHPGYSIANALRKDSGMAENETQVRDVALFFDVLRKSGTEPVYYGTALSRLRSITKTDNLALLMHVYPEYARAILRLVLHFTTKFGGPTDMEPTLHSMVKEAPETADDIISYAKDRGITALESITREALTNWQDTTAPLRDGAL